MYRGSCSQTAPEESSWLNRRRVKYRNSIGNAVTGCDNGRHVVLPGRRWETYKQRLLGPAQQHCSHTETQKRISSPVTFRNKYFGLQCVTVCLTPVFLQEHWIRNRAMMAGKWRRLTKCFYRGITSLLAEKRSDGINKCNSSWWPEADTTEEERSSKMDAVLGTGSCYVRCFIANSTAYKNVKYITSCAPLEH